MKDEIAAIERQILEKLDHTRARFAHSGNKGTSLEAAVRDFLSGFLPRRLSVGHGEVIDTRGHRSRQSDIVIVNEDHPITFSESVPGIFFVEGVSAVGEVKAVLTSDHLNSAIANSRKFRALESRFYNGDMTVAKESDHKRFLKSPPWFVLAYESQLSLDAIGERLRQASDNGNGTGYDLIDAVVVLRKGTVINFGDGEGTLRFQQEDGQYLRSWVLRHSDAPLFEFLGWLSAAMPRVLRFQSIVLPYYGVILSDKFPVQER